MERLTHQEQQMFQELTQSSIGSVLASYLERTAVKMCDLRTLDGIDEIKRLARLEAVKIFEDSLLKYLKPSEQLEDVTPESYV